MIYSAKLLTAGETASMLWSLLGPMRQWSHFLADCIRDHQHIAGITLMPCARLQGVRGYGPAYSLDDIKTFIRAVKAAAPGTGKKIIPVTARLDTCKGWRITKIDRKGNPVARHQGIPHACTSPRAITFGS